MASSSFDADPRSVIAVSDEGERPNTHHNTPAAIQSPTTSIANSTIPSNADKIILGSVSHLYRFVFGSPSEPIPSGIRPVHSLAPGPDYATYLRQHTLHHIDSLSSGGQGSLSLHLNKTTNTLLVEKRHSCTCRADLLIPAVRQLQQYTQSRFLQHIHAWQFNEDATPIRMFLVFADGINLAEFKRRSLAARRHFDPRFLRHVADSVARGLDFMHNGPACVRDDWVPVLHRDMKPANVMLCSPARPGLFPQVKIVDLDNVALDMPETPRPRFRTPGWSAPEWPYYGVKGDMWGLGAIVLYLATGVKPDNASKCAPTVTDSVDRLEAAHGGPRHGTVPVESPDVSRKFGKGLSSVVEGCLRFDPRERWGAAEAVRVLNGEMDAQRRIGGRKGLSRGDRKLIQYRGLPKAWEVVGLGNEEW